ncbi:MAG: hypothetical protein Q7R67_00185 [bacterium]|nr:hypothetical protein [bacterium]
MEKKFVLSIVESENTKYGYNPCECSDCTHWSINFEPSADEAAVKELCDFVNRVSHSKGKIKELGEKECKFLSALLGINITGGLPYVEARYWEYQEPRPEPPPSSVSEAFRRLHNLKRGS